MPASQGFHKGCFWEGGSQLWFVKLGGQEITGCVWQQGLLEFLFAGVVHG